MTNLPIVLEQTWICHFQPSLESKTLENFFLPWYFLTSLHFPSHYTYNSEIADIIKEVELGKLKRTPAAKRMSLTELSSIVLFFTCYHFFPLFYFYFSQLNIFLFSIEHWNITEVFYKITLFLFIFCMYLYAYDSINYSCLKRVFFIDQHYKMFLYYKKRFLKEKECITSSTSPTGDWFRFIKMSLTMQIYSY